MIKVHFVRDCKLYWSSLACWQVAKPRISRGFQTPSDISPSGHDAKMLLTLPTFLVAIYLRWIKKRKIIIITELRIEHQWMYSHSDIFPDVPPTDILSRRSYWLWVNPCGKWKITRSIYISWRSDSRWKKKILLFIECCVMIKFGNLPESTYLMYIIQQRGKPWQDS